MNITLKRRTRLEKIVELRKAGLTQKEIADRLGVSITQVVEDCKTIKKLKIKPIPVKEKEEEAKKPELEIPAVLTREVIADATLEAMYKLLKKIGDGGKAGKEAADIYARLWVEKE